jgi:hypothetical protein
LTAKFTEEEVHQYLHKHGLEKLVVVSPPLMLLLGRAAMMNEVEFELWRFIKAKCPS